MWFIGSNVLVELSESNIYQIITEFFYCGYTSKRQVIIYILENTRLQHISTPHGPLHGDGNCMRLNILQDKTRRRGISLCICLPLTLPMSPLMQRLIASKIICDSGDCIQRNYIATFSRRKYFKIETHNFFFPTTHHLKGKAKTVSDNPLHPNYVTIVTRITVPTVTPACTSWITNHIN